MMEGNLTKPRAILVFGAPASGKTTFCEKFSQKFRAPYYNLTDLADECDFSRANLMLILQLLTQTGANLIIEGGLDTEKERDEIRKLFLKSGYNPSLIWIQTDTNTIKARLKQRTKSVSQAKALYDQAIASMEAPAEVENAIILSGKHTFMTQLNQVLSQLAR